MTARALTLTREVHAALVAARRVGAPLRHCAKAAGVPWRTLCDWLQKGRDGDARFAALAAELDARAIELERAVGGAYWAWGGARLRPPGPRAHRGRGGPGRPPPGARGVREGVAQG